MTIRRWISITMLTVLCPGLLSVGSGGLPLGRLSPEYIPGDFCGLPLDAQGKVVLEDGRIPSAVVPTWPNVGADSVMTYVLDPDLPPEAKAAFRRAAEQLSNGGSSAIAGASTLRLVESSVPWDDAALNLCKFGGNVWRTTVASYSPGDPNPADEIADLAVHWYEKVVDDEGFPVDLECSSDSDGPGWDLLSRLQFQEYDGWTEYNPQSLYEFDPTTQTCTRIGGGVLAFDAGRDWDFGLDAVPTANDGGTPLSFEYVAMHELLHFVLGTDHNLAGNGATSLLPEAAREYSELAFWEDAPSLLDPAYPVGGDPGGETDGFRPPDAMGAIRVGPRAFQVIDHLYRAPGGATVDNLVLYKWAREFDAASLPQPDTVAEMWTTEQDPAGFWTTHVSGDFVDFDSAATPLLTMPQVGFVSTVGEARIRALWYLVEDGQSCTDGYPVTWLEDSGDQRGGAEAWYGASEFTVTNERRTPVEPPTGIALCTEFLYSPKLDRKIEEGEYRLCVTVRHTDPAIQESSMDDNTVYSDRPFLVAPGNATYSVCGSVSRLPAP